MTADHSVLSLTLPHWLTNFGRDAPDTFASDEARVRFAIELARRNVEHGQSPFGAAVFDDQGLVAAGVNCVLSSGYSIAHAEIVALMHAQQRTRLQAGQAPKPLVLVSSAEPCCQCFGALFWAGVTRLVYAANRSDVEAIGFDEGPKPHDWRARLRERGIALVEELCRDEAQTPLRTYQANAGPIYGLRQLR